MSIIVQKYGGSSVADIERLQRVAAKVVATRAAGHDVVVIVSAMGKTTDNLLALARDAARVSERPSEPPKRELDMLVSTGERTSMALLSIAIHALGHEAISFTGSQSGIITNDRHFDARIIEVRPHRIEDELARGKIVIVAGYQGMSYRREITTLGRGGSDTTAVALAAALNAERCEIYSDVDGVYTADPRVVADAAHLPELDAATLQEMAECGAKVVNAQAVEWARKAKIAIHARSTADGWERGGGHRETIVRETSTTTHARAVVGEANLVVGHLLGDATLLHKLADCAAREAIPLKDLSFRSGVTTFVISRLNVPDWNRAKAGLLRELPHTTLDENVAAVSVVGDGLSTTGEPLARFLGALQGAGIEATGVYATPLRLTATIDPAKLAEAQREVHAALVSSSL
ncbi:MAG: aspartate kinase [Polyangiaceae bacterium]